MSVARVRRAAGRAPGGGGGRDLPDPWQEIRLLGISTLPGANFWSQGPVTRVDLVPGAYDEISSALVPGFTDALVAALPGLREHRCSVGERGGFVTRLRRGTYAPHIMEHVALELQAVAGYDAGFGRARGGDRPGEYTVVLEHHHSAVGRLAAQIGLEVVRRALAGTLPDVGEAVEALRRVGLDPDEQPPPTRQLRVAVTGGRRRREVAQAVRERLGRAGVLELPPARILRAGLPYRRSRLAVIADSDPGAVPPRYRDAERARQLLSVVADAVARPGVIVLPAQEWEMQRELHERGWRVALFAGEEGVDPRDARLAHAMATVRHGQVRVEIGGAEADPVPLRREAHPAAQAAASLTERLLQQTE